MDSNEHPDPTSINFGIARLESPTETKSDRDREKKKRVTQSCNVSQRKINLLVLVLTSICSEFLAIPLCIYIYGLFGLSGYRFVAKRGCVVNVTGFEPDLM